MEKRNTITVRYKHLSGGSGTRVNFKDGKSVVFNESFQVMKVDEKYRETFEKAPDFEIINVKTTIGGKKK